jgi:hypothetical protein
LSNYKAVDEFEPIIHTVEASAKASSIPGSGILGMYMERKKHPNDTNPNKDSCEDDASNVHGVGRQYPGYQGMARSGEQHVV